VIKVLADALQWIAPIDSKQALMLFRKRITQTHRDCREPGRELLNGNRESRERRPAQKASDLGAAAK
jgi:hypothetical protein